MFKLIMKREDFSGSALVVYSPQMVMISEIKDKGSKITFTAVDLANIQRRAETKNLTRNLFKTFP